MFPTMENRINRADPSGILRDSTSRESIPAATSLRCHTAPFIEERDQTDAIKAMKLTRKSKEFGS